MFAITILTNTVLMSQSNKDNKSKGSVEKVCMKRATELQNVALDPKQNLF